MADGTQTEAESPDPGRGRPPKPTTSPDADRYLSDDAEGGGISESMPDQATDRTGTKDIKTENRTGTNDIEPKTENQTQIQLDQGQINLDPDVNPPISEDLEGNLAVLPEIPISTTAKVSIEDLQVGETGSATPEEIERLGK
ncbi:hypothetical protein PHMEG_00039410 [Phytophthora megakarya]|uniref:Eukaryotic/viral aspartic protease n=1 Tax=Phytophthora megakarya TaxID=4795 RepID=A0A225UFJ0_9STRA|nr:hypothetical protein PHMEG_00039410 [Phytophthora megakarya]